MSSQVSMVKKIHLTVQVLIKQGEIYEFEPHLEQNDFWCFPVNTLQYIPIMSDDVINS